MARSKTSKSWLKEHESDPFVQRARREGYRSRAVYKLQEVDQKDRLFKPGMLVVELGAAPGGWSQWVSQRMGPRGEIIALDLLPVDPYDKVTFIQGDFQDELVYNQLMDAIAGRPVDVVLSDLSPNHTGVKSVDIPRSMYLSELTVDLADQVLKPGGDLFIKVFQGEGFDTLLQNLRSKYHKVMSRKPEASRGRSRELYLLARDKKS